MATPVHTAESVLTIIPAPETDKLDINLMPNTFSNIYLFIINVKKTDVRFK